MRSLVLAALALTLALPASAATLNDQFTFDTGLTNSTGAATAAGLGTVAGGRYVFAFNQGLTVALGAALTEWSIVFKGQIETTDGWRKLIDLSGLASDSGLYNYYTRMTYETDHIWGPEGAIAANTDFIGALTFSGNTVKGYVNGIEQISFTTPGGLGYPGALSSMVLFEDDVATGKGEASPGSLDFVQVYDGALSGDDVAALSTVPLPASAPLMLAGLAGFLALRRRKA